MNIEIRTIVEGDAEAFVQLSQHLDIETRYMLFEPDERDTNVNEQARKLRNLLASDNSTIIVATDGRIIVGYVLVVGGGLRRNGHCAHLVIGILQAFSGQGVGRRLFNAMEEWRLNTSLRRIELTVMAHNIRAIRLYEEMGFLQEGIRRQSLKVDGTFVDEYHMAKLFS